jgi:hypothetical protein
MHILEKDTLFIWDERAHESFDSLKKSLVSTPLLSSPNYSRYIMIFIATSKGMVGMVLIQGG